MELGVIFLTPDYYKVFFKDTTTDDCKELGKKIIENEFNEYAKSPFKVYYLEDMLANPNTHGDKGDMQSAIKKGKAYLIHPKKKGRLHFIVPIENAEYFVSKRGIRRYEKIEALKSEILDNYERFQQWRARI